ncbi:hypothetical protein [Deminuibacter soli]|uniref:Uncharacterized protein n=1 Tax=Deminuibacter soli TaxID=2291815 RepID=A0A3E1NM06_9BACT|nr:hypothetical protein [Deminuibacter soli]RFM28838.1 hypothetical protein DXN05_08680 [Deminuibacter soli]
MYFKPSQEKSDGNIALLRELFNKTVDTPQQYEILYAPHAYTRYLWVFKKRVHENYLLGYNLHNHSFALFSFAYEQGMFLSGPVEYFTRNDIQSFSCDFFGTHILKLRSNKTFRFSIVPYTTTEYVVALRQEEEASALLTALKAI